MFNFIIFFSLVFKSSGEWIVGDTLSSKDHSEVYKSKFQHRLQLGGKEWALLEYQREQEKKLSQNIQELQDLNAEILEHMDVKLNNELQQLHKQSKAFVDELQEKKKEMKEQYQQQLKEIEEKNLQLTLSKEKESDLQFELQKKQEEFAEKEKEFSELKHQLEKKEQQIQEYSHLLQVNKKELEECQDALRTQKLKNESQTIQLLHHAPQGMYCIYSSCICDSICT